MAQVMLVTALMAVIITLFSGVYILTVMHSRPRLLCRCRFDYYLVFAMMFTSGYAVYQTGFWNVALLVVIALYLLTRANKYKQYGHYHPTRRPV